MKRYELESLIKSFLLFFVLMLSLYLLVGWQNYKNQNQQIDKTILNEMKIFSFKPLSGEFDIAFVEKSEAVDKTLVELYRDASGVFAFFAIPDSQKYSMKVLLPKKNYDERISTLKGKVFAGIYFYILLIAIVALLLSFYTLYPLRKALLLNGEFVRDILHDINTPLSSLLINLKIIKKRFGSQRSFDRMENNIETIQNLQSNLRSFMHRQPKSMEKFLLSVVLADRIEYFRILYPEVEFVLETKQEVLLECNQKAFVRVLDNLIGNAGKYNVKNGQVSVVFKEGILEIKDTGVGIRDTDRVFDRYYKEGERGLGIGLNIVKKLVDELGITMTLNSELSVGTTILLDIAGVTVK